MHPRIRTKYALEDAKPSLYASFTSTYKAMTKQGFNHGDSYENDHKWDQGKASSGITYTFKLNPRLNESNTK